MNAGRMRDLTAILAALCACAVAAIHAAEFEAFAVSVHFQVDHSIESRLIKRDLEDEAAAICKPYGVQLEWTEAREPEAPARLFSLETIVERAIDQPKPPDSAIVMGRAPVQLDAPAREPIRVSFDATASVLARRTSSRASIIGSVDKHEVTRALGRVLAHEIGHVLLGAPYHDQAGLMRAVFVPNELADEDRTPFRLTCTGVARLRSRLRVPTDDRRFHDGPDRACKPDRMVR